MRLTLILLLVGIAISFAAKVPQAPEWPKQYYIQGTFTLPYINLKEPVAVYYDAVNSKQKISYYHDQDVYLYRYDMKTLYEVVPRINTPTCYVQAIGSGPMVDILPDLSKWNYVGQTTERGILCDTWKQVVTNFNKTATYHFYASNGVPIKMYLEGYDFVFGSHPDLYEFTYDVYVPDYDDPTTYNQPDLCKGTKKQAHLGRSHRAKSLLGQLSVLNPKETLDEFEEFAARFKKYYFTEEIKERRNNYFTSKKIVESHNRRNHVSHKLAINHFSDMSHDEWRSVMIPKPKSKPTVDLSDARPHVRTPNANIPAALDWRAIGAVTPVKDQGACGSCWTFGTAGSVEGSWFVKTGQLISLSEQQILDCSWRHWAEEDNTGCDGGFAAPAMQWIKDNGGLATEFDYPYMMQDGYCKPSMRSSVKITGYVNVTSGSEQALLEAVALYGPVAIAIDAAHPEFEYYTDGIYYNPACKNDLDDLDHEVLVVGYGSDGPGQDYWIVKNSWSIYWGDKGFVKMARNRNNNCGIATQANYALV